MKLSIILFALLLGSTAKAGINVSFDETTRSGRVNMNIDFSGFVINNGSNTETYKMTIVNQDLPAGWGISFCSPTGCYPVGTTTTTFNGSAGGQSYILLETHTNTNIGTGTYDVIFENLTNGGDTTISFSAAVYSFSYSQLNDTTQCYPNNTEAIKMTVYNNTSAALELNQKILYTSLPAGWEIEACNPNGCFDGLGNSDDFTISQGAFSNTKLMIKSNGDAGIATVVVRFSELNNSAVYQDVQYVGISEGWTVGLEETIESDKLLIPQSQNPSDGNAMYLLNGDISGNIKVVNLAGQQVMSNRISGRSIHLNNLPEGILFVIVETDNGLSEVQRLEVLK